MQPDLSTPSYPTKDITTTTTSNSDELSINIDPNPVQATTTCSSPSSDTSDSHHQDDHHPKLCSKMVKYTSLTIFIAFFLILTTIAVSGDGGGDGEAQNPDPSTTTGARSKARSKLSSAVRKKKTGVAKAKIELTTTSTTTTTVIPPTAPPTFEDSSGEAGHSSTEVESSATSTTARRSVTDDPVTSSLTPTQAPVRRRVTNNSPRTGPVPEGCGDCDQEDCHTPAVATCPNGLVLDRCSCCLVCGVLEGNRCFNSSLNLPYNPDVGICGPQMDCLLREDLDPSEPREALCECRDKRIVCGNDHKTYLSECKLREAAHSKPNLIVTTWSPCVSAPVITTPIDNVTVGIGEDVSLSCEVRAYPAPILHWEFVAEGSPTTTLRQILPGDDSGIVVVVRGGPEQIMQTSWIQLIDVSPKRHGIYFCVAKNTEGLIQASAQVRVYDE